jgi:hypothetical protein
MAAGLLAAVAVIPCAAGAGPPPEDPSGPGSVVIVHATVQHPGTARVDTLNWSYPGYVALRGAGDVFEELAAFRGHAMRLQSGERVSVEMVSHTYFSVLEVGAVVGRTFRADEDAAPLAAPVALLGHGLWRREFGADPRVLGATVELDGRAFTVIGVLPEGFRGLSDSAEVWVPLMMAPVAYPDDVWFEARTSWLGVVGRLKPDVTFGEAEAAVADAAARVAHVEGAPGEWGGCGGATIVPVESATGDARLRRAAWVL